MKSTTTRGISRASAALCLVTLAACGGGGTSVSTRASAPATTMPQPTATPTSSPTQMPVATTGTARISVTEPQPSGRQSRSRRPAFLSGNTTSIVIAIANVPTTFSFGQLSSACAPQGPSIVCSVDLPAPTGMQTISVTTYDAAGASGHALATALTTATISGGTTTIVPLTLRGIAKTATVALGNVHPPLGTATTMPVAVVAYDADGNTITGSAPYAAPIPLLDSDTSGHTQLSASSVSGPSSAITLAYDGASVNATIAAFSGGASVPYPPVNRIVPAIAPTEYPLPTGQRSAGSLVLGSDNALYFTATGGLGRATQSGVTTLLSSGQVATLAPGPAGNGIVWAMTSSSNGSALSRLNSDSTLTNYSIYETGAFTLGPDGNFWEGDTNVSRITPTGTQTNYILNTGPNQHEVSSVVTGPDKNLWFADSDGYIERVTTSGTVTTFPIGVTAGGSTSIVVGGDGALWAAFSSSGGFRRMTTAGALTYFPTDTSFAQSFGDGYNQPPVALASDGNIWYGTVKYGQSLNDPDGFSYITPTGKVVDFTLVSSATPSSNSFATHVNALLSTPDGSLWYTHEGVIGKFRPPSF